MLLPKTRFTTMPAGVGVVRGGVTTPQGFSAAGVATGVKKKGRSDAESTAAAEPHSAEGRDHTSAADDLTEQGSADS